MKTYEPGFYRIEQTCKCQFCGKHFLPRRSSQKYCPGRSCMQKAYRRRAGHVAPQTRRACRYCRKKFKPVSGKQYYCHPSCQVKASNDRRAKKKRHGIEPYSSLTRRVMGSRRSYQVTIPMQLCRQLNITPGTRVDFKYLTPTSLKLTILATGD